MVVRGRYNPKGVPDDTHAGSVEIIADGNIADEDGNWRFIIVGNNFEVQVKDGTWKFASGFTPP